MHLNQILDDYKNSDDEDKDQILDEFITRLWKSKYSLKKYKKKFTYNVNENLLRDNPALIELFKKYSSIEYTVCKSFYSKRLDPIDYIRVHINNTYGYLVDKDIYYSSQYYKLLAVPKNEYFKTIEELKNGLHVDPEEIRNRIMVALDEADTIKLKSVNKKIDLPFPAYKKLVNGYLRRMFENYKPVEDYEKEHGWEIRVVVDGWSEDNYVIKYFCRSLTGYMRNYKKGLIPKVQKKKYCKICSIAIINSANKRKYCVHCAKENERKNHNLRQAKYRKK